MTLNEKSLWKYSRWSCNLQKTKKKGGSAPQGEGKRRVYLLKDNSPIGYIGCEW